MIVSTEREAKCTHVLKYVLTLAKSFSINCYGVFKLLLAFFFYMVNV